MRLFGSDAANTSNGTSRLGVLTSLNELALSLREGFDAISARRIGETAQSVLGVRAVAVTSDNETLAIVGTDESPWDQAIAEQTSEIVQRRRVRRPTVYQLLLGRGQVEVAAAAFLSDDEVVGTIHVIPNETEPLNTAELSQFAQLISTQLELGELEQSRTQAAQAELRALRAQVSPHFVHNSLTAIAGLVNTDPGKARELIATFAEFLRASFRERSQLTSVAEELRLVEAYLELEQARFGNRFDVSLNIAPEALPVRIPFLSIQPIVENAIRHGLEARPGTGAVMIVAENAGPEIAIHIEDDGVGIDPESLERALRGNDTTSHVGILAVDTRLRSTFGQEYGLTIETGNNAGTKISIRLPKYVSHPR